MSAAKMLSVIIVNQDLKDKPGFMASVSFVLGLTAGTLLPDSTFGTPVVDGDGLTHARLTNIGHRSRKATGSKLRSLRTELAKHADVVVVDYPEAAAPVDYAMYAESLQAQSGENISYAALWAYGPEEVVGPLTKSLSQL